ncbi:MAG: hypothetical protein PHY64_06340 [Eubacteriales bacterium]|nr:hypothetical protein [Eubacteriales bacterium]
MKQYEANERVPMKFHHLYVYFLNPLKILFLGLLTALSLILYLNVDMLPSDTLRQAGLTYLQGEELLLALVILLGLAFLFALVAEILLAARRVLGVTLLILGYVMDVIGSAVNVVHDTTSNNLTLLVVNALLAALVCIYYWKRAKLLH